MRTRHLSGSSILTAALLLLGLLAGRTTSADDRIRIGYGEGSPGDTGVHVIITATNDAVLHGFSLALAYPRDVLSLSELTVDGTHVGEMEPEFAEPDVDDDLGIASLGVLFDFGDTVGTKSLAPTEEGDSPTIIARLTFNVRANAPGGVYALQLLDGIGSPAAYNRFVSGQTSVSPILEDGEFFVRGGNVLSLQSTQAICGATPQVVLTASAIHPDPLAGFQVGLSYDPEKVEISNVTYAGTDLGFELGNSGQIEFFSTEILEGRGSLGARSRTGVIFDYVAPYNGQALPPAPEAPGHSILRYTVRLRNGGLDCAVDTAVDLLLENLDLAGSVNNAFIVDSTSIEPRVVHGKVFFSTGDLRGRVLDADTGAGLRGVRVETDPRGLAATTDGNGVFRINTLAPGAYTLRFRKDGYYSERAANVQVAGNFALNEAGDFTLFEVPETPIRRNPFRRGFVNADLRADLSDAVTILNYLFLGSGAPTCLAAADVNDSNILDIADGIFMLQWLFNGGPEPFAPFGACGFDDEASPLGCNQSPACP